jgi:hypothetical protein
MSLNVGNQRNNFGRKINYLSKDFEQFRNNLIEYSKIYFPNSYNDFSEASPGMLFIEMASYIGDVLSYYIDDTLKESLMMYAEDRPNVMALSKFLGYKPKVTTPSVVRVAVYQTIPSRMLAASIHMDTINGDEKYTPDERFYLKIKEGMVLESNNGISFRTTEPIDFAVDDDREISIYSRDNLGYPFQYVVKKYVNAISAQTRSVNYNFGSTPQQFSKIDIADTNIIDITDVRDSNGNKWYHVPYLAQESVYIDYPTSELTDKDLLQFKDSVPYVLKLIRTSKRFTTNVNSDNTTSIIFGGGNSLEPDETIIPNFKNVGLGLRSSIDRLEASFDPANFLKTKTYGEAPTGEFKITYLVGGGVESNVGVNQINKINIIEFDEDAGIFNDAELSLYNTTKSSVVVDNETPASGGKGAETVEEIRQNALVNFGSQNRAVTRKDYQVRCLAMPAKYGGIAKAYCAPDGELDNNSPGSILTNPNTLKEFTDLVMEFKNTEPTNDIIENEIRNFVFNHTSKFNETYNPLSINLYLLGYDSEKKLTTLNRAVKENLKTYLKEFKIITDSVSIIDGFWVNIGVDFEIRTYAGYNNQEVLLKCIEEIKNYFNIDNWSFNMPINISELELIIASVEGVQSVPKCEIFNLNIKNGNYSRYSYNIAEATLNKLIYPAVDPMVFELKYPNKDIRGRVV